MVNEFTEQDDLVRVKAEYLHEDDRGVRLARKHREDRFCATWMVEWEAEIIRRSKERENETDLKLFRSTVDRVIAAYEKRKGFTLTEEQNAAIGHLTHGTAGVGVGVGRHRQDHRGRGLQAVLRSRRKAVDGLGRVG